MTSARIVTFGHAMAMIPTMMARMPSRINEVDVDLNMKGDSFRSAQSHHAVLEVCGAGQHQETRRLLTPTNICGLWTHSCGLGVEHIGIRGGIERRQGRAAAGHRPGQGGPAVTRKSAGSLLTCRYVLSPVRLISRLTMGWQPVMTSSWPCRARMSWAQTRTDRPAQSVKASADRSATRVLGPRSRA